MNATTRTDILSEKAATALWIGSVAVFSVLFSLALACATPFPALTTIAGAKMRWRAAAALVGLAWLMNQAVGYLVLDYPRSWDSFAWGVTIGLAALLAIVPAYAIARRMQAVAALLGGFGSAFLLYEAVLFSATAFLPSGPGAFAPAIVWQIFWINALALAGLIVLHWAALSIGIAPRAAVPQPALSHA